MSNSIVSKMKEEPNHLDFEKYPHVRGSDLFKILKYLPRLNSNGGPWVAGGSVWRTVNNEMLKDCDIDMFFNNKSGYEEACQLMNGYPYINNILSEKKTKWNTTYQIHVNEGKFDKTIDVQFIGMAYFPKLEKLLNSFDFSVCQFGYDGKDIIVGNKALSDLEKRQITLHKINHPKSTFKHMLKYLNNGFTLPPEEFKRLVEFMLRSDCWGKDASGKYDDDKNVKETIEVTPEWATEWGADDNRPIRNIRPNNNRNRVVDPVISHRNGYYTANINTIRNNNQVVDDVNPIINQVIDPPVPMPPRYYTTMNNTGMAAPETTDVQIQWGPQYGNTVATVPTQEYMTDTINMVTPNEVPTIPMDLRTTTTVNDQTLNTVAEPNDNREERPPRYRDELTERLLRRLREFDANDPTNLNNPIENARLTNNNGHTTINTDNEQDWEGYGYHPRITNN